MRSSRKKNKEKEKEDQDAVRKAKKQQKLGAEREKVRKSCETNKNNLNKINKKELDHTAKLTINKLKDLIKYHFSSNWHKDSKLRKLDFVSIVCELFVSTIVENNQDANISDNVSLPIYKSNWKKKSVKMKVTCKVSIISN